MQAIDFPQKTRDIGKPKGSTDEQCTSLPAYVGTEDNHGEKWPVIISCFEPTPAELEALNKGGKIWLRAYTYQMVPVYLGVDNPFE